MAGNEIIDVMRKYFIISMKAMAYEKRQYSMTVIINDISNDGK